MNTSIKSIVEIIVKSEKSLLQSQHDNYKNYVSQQDEWSELTKIERKTVLEQIANASAAIDLRTVQNNFAKLMRAKGNGIDATKYVSFTSLNNASIAKESGVGTLVKTGKDAGKVKITKKAQAEQEATESGKAKAKAMEIAQIAQDPKTIEFIAYAIEQGWNMNNVRLALPKKAPAVEA